MNAGDLIKRSIGYSAVGLHRMFRNRTAGQLGILVHHRVTDVPSSLPLPHFTVTPGRFHDQLRGLQKRGYNFVTLQQAIRLSQVGEPWPSKSLVVTFDDGFECVYLHAWPVLRKLGIPATIFLCTAYLDSDDPFPFDPWGHACRDRVDPSTYRPLREWQCREMLEDGIIELGAHTHTHRDFRNRPTALRDDLRLNIEQLEQRFGIQTPTFAFPFGRIALGYAGGELAEAARQTEVACALTTECETNRLGSDPFHWGRYNAYEWDTPSTLIAKISGWYGWAPKVQEWLARCKATIQRRGGSCKELVEPEAKKETEPDKETTPSERCAVPRHGDEPGFEPGPRRSNGQVLDDAFDVSDPPWWDQLEDVALRGVSGVGIVLNTVFGRRSGTQPAIVNYHRVAWNVPGLPPPQHNVTPTSFREQLEGLLDRGFTFWPLDRLMDHAARQETVPSRTVVVTFDDGFETVYTRAWPVLRDLDIPASLFITTKYIGSAEPFPFDAWGVRYQAESPEEVYRPLTIEQLREMIGSGLIQLGAHTATHEDFRGRPDAFQEDVATSVEFLRKHFGLLEPTFAFPFGSPHRGFVDADLIEAAKVAGVTCGLTTDPTVVERITDPFTWGRFNAFPWDTSRSLAAKVNGWYSWAPRTKRRVVGCVKGMTGCGTSACTTV